MAAPQDQVDELKILFGEIKAYEEAGITYFLIPSLQLPDGCVPLTVDALLCPVPRDGYNGRLFFAEQVQTKTARNWNGHFRICERNWRAFSWTVPANLRLAQIVTLILSAMR